MFHGQDELYRNDQTIESPKKRLKKAHRIHRKHGGNLSLKAFALEAINQRSTQADNKEAARQWFRNKRSSLA